MIRRSFFLTILALATAVAPVAHARPIGMVTGPETGTYIQIGRDLAGITKGSNVQIQVKPSLGSVDNVRRMSTRTENAGLGIVQSDVLSFLRRSGSPESQQIAGKLRMVAPFYGEEVHVIARRDISRVEDLTGKNVAVGTEGSGTMLTATNIFSLLNVKPGKLYNTAPAEAVVAVLTGQADAAVFVGGKPVKLFKNMEALATTKGSTAEANAQALANVHFLPLEDTRLKDDYAPAMITSADYSFVKQAVPTVAVRAVLVSYDFTLKNEPYYHARCAEMGRIGNALQQRISYLQQNGHPKWKEVDLNTDSGVALWKRDSCAWPAPKPQTTVATVKPAPKAAPVANNLPQLAPAAGMPDKQPVNTQNTSLLRHTPTVHQDTQRLQNELLLIVDRK